MSTAGTGGSSPSRSIAGPRGSTSCWQPRPSPTHSPSSTGCSPSPTRCCGSRSSGGPRRRTSPLPGGGHPSGDEFGKVVMEMANENQIVIVGNLTDDPELRYTPNGAAVANFRVAVSRRYKDEAGNWKDGETSYFTVNAWRSLAENVAESLTRGTRVVVAGRLQMRSWETQEGDKLTVVEIEADEIGPSLRWATAKVERQGRSGSSDWSAPV